MLTARNTSLAAVGGILILGAVGIAALSEDRSVSEAWLFGFITVAAFATGGLVLLMIGHVLGELWLKPIHGELNAMALTMPVIALLAVPVALRREELYPDVDADIQSGFISGPHFTTRMFIILSIWTVLSIWIARTSSVRKASAIGLLLLPPTAIFAVSDWLLARDPAFGASLLPFALIVSQCAAALACSLVVTLARSGIVHPERLLSLERSLLVFILLVPWIWFTLFLIVWLADLPNEAAWFLSRSGHWLVAPSISLVAFAIAAVLLAFSFRDGRTIFAAAGLILVQHVASTLWLVRPDIDDILQTFLVFGSVVAIWIVSFAVGLHARRVFEMAP